LHFDLPRCCRPVPRWDERCLCNDRKVGCAQYVFRHRTQEQLAQLATASRAEKNAIHLELAERIDDLLCGIAFADDGVAAGALVVGESAPGLQGHGCCVKCGVRIEVRNAGGIRGHDRCGGRDVEENQVCARLRCLLESKRHKAAKVAKVSGDEEDIGACPAPQSVVLG